MSRTGVEPRLVPLLLAGAAVVAALLAGRAAQVSSRASGQWNDALRVQLSDQGVLAEDLRYSLNDLGRAAVDIVIAEQSAGADRDVSRTVSEPARSILLADAAARDAITTSGLHRDELFPEASSRTPHGGYNVVARLADERAKNPPRVTPSRLAREGDGLSRQALHTTTALLPAALAFASAALAQAFPRVRTALLRFSVVALVFAVGLGLIVEVA